MTTIADTIEVVWRIESARLIASMVRLVRDVGLAEDLAQETFAAAWEAWSQSGPRPTAGLVAHHGPTQGDRRHPARAEPQDQVRGAGDESERDGADPDEPIR